jgi:hypothetical protein
MSKKNIKKEKETYVINPLSSKELSGFLDSKSKNVIKYFIVKCLFAQPEAKTGQSQLPIQVPKEHVEQWFVQAFDVKPVGAGSYPIDIYNEREGWGADIKMLNIKFNNAGVMTNSDSGEASLGQKFEGPGVDLDKLFKTKKFENIKDEWINLYKNKYDSLKARYSVNKIYYFFILRPGTQQHGADFFFTGAVLDLNKLKDVTVNKSRTTAKSVFLDNFINSEFGNTKIYKAKKRLELRLKPKKWLDENNLIKITTSFVSQPVNLRDKVVDSKYLKDEIEKINNIRIDFID